MASESPLLARSLLGYRASDVQQLLADRERMFTLAQDEAKKAEAEAAALRKQLDAARMELHDQARTVDTMISRSQQELDAANKSAKGRDERVAIAESRTVELSTQLEKTRTELGTAQTELRSRTEAIGTLQGELEVVRAQADAAEGRVATLRHQLDESRAKPAEHDHTTDATQDVVTDDLTQILRFAEDGIQGILERAKDAYQQQFAEAERERIAVRSEIDRFEDWQTRIQPQIKTIQEEMSRGQEHIVSVSHQIRGLVGSMTEAIGSVSDSLERLADLPRPIVNAPAPDRGPDEEDRAHRVIRLRDDEAAGYAGKGEFTDDEHTGSPPTPRPGMQPDAPQSKPWRY
jgi:predicted  nucleic acid-binding Zn-ribbon protein